MARLIIGERCTQIHDFERRTRKAAAGFAMMGIGAGDTIALLMRNDIAFLEASVAAGLLGASPVPINWHSTAAEADYVLRDCAAKVLVAHADLHRSMAGMMPFEIGVVLVTPLPEIARAYGIENIAPDSESAPDWESWLASYDPWPHPAREDPGAMIYTSGTTGNPKGVRRPAPTPQQSEGAARLAAQAYGLARRAKPTITLVTAPLYHSAPNMHAMTSLRIGADVVIQPRFDPEDALTLIERHRVTHAYMAPIMFRRLLQLPEAVRRRYDLTSLEFVIHAAAPCPQDVKRAMIDWWGPVIHEFFGSTETRAMTGCNSAEWLERPGTVGRALADGQVRILDDHGHDCPPMVPGEVACCHPALAGFTYHGDAAKRQSVERSGLIATGDIGYLDEAGYLFICDRKSDMIISGGVNIYPAEVEASLASLPGVRDCAVFGIPDEEFGEAVMAAVESIDGHRLDTEGLKTALRSRLAGYKIPRVIEQHRSLPRDDSGKIFKRKLRDPYWAQIDRKI